jgi:hypothetical protein
MIEGQNQRTPPVVGRRRSETMKPMSCAAFIAGWRPRARERRIVVSYYHLLRNPGITRECAYAGER